MQCSRFHNYVWNKHENCFIIMFIFLKQLDPYPQALKLLKCLRISVIEVAKNWLIFFTERRVPTWPNIDRLQL